MGVLQNSAVKFEVDTAAVTCWHVLVNEIVFQVPGGMFVLQQTATVHEYIDWTKCKFYAVAKASSFTKISAFVTLLFGTNHLPLSTKNNIYYDSHLLFLF